jgi:hypothetical protein
MNRVLRLSPERSAGPNYGAILDQLDHASRSAVPGRAAPRERAPRFAYRHARLPMIVLQPGGGTTPMIVASRNLSTSGIGILSEGFLHRGSKCVVALIALDGQSTSVPGIVVHCRHIRGRVHEVGVQFDAAIDVALFLKPEASGPAGAAPGTSPPPPNPPAGT